MWKIVLPVLAAVFAVGLGGLVGGFADVDINDESVQNALKVAVVNHNNRQNDMYLRQAAEVVKAQRQVVSGMKYTITVRMERTNCIKSSVNEVCATHQDPTTNYLCTFEVWDRPWLSDIRVLKETC